MTTTVIGLTVVIGGGSIFLVVGMALFGQRATARLPGSIRDWLERLRVGALLSLRGRLWPVTILSVSGWAAEGCVSRLYPIVGLDVPLPVIAFVALATTYNRDSGPPPGRPRVAEAGMLAIAAVGSAGGRRRPEALDRSVTCSARPNRWCALGCGRECDGPRIR